MPIGTILAYDGTGLDAVETRTQEIGWYGGDTISMAGWYVCNGESGTPNLFDKFVRGAIVSGTTGGSDDAVVVEHRHDIEVNTGGAGAVPLITLDADSVQDGTSVTEYVGVSGVNANVPAFYRVIYIIRKS